MAAPRLSLRWQVVIGLMLVLSLLLAVSQYLAWRNLSGQLEQRNLALLSRQQNHFNLLLQGLAERLTLEAEANCLSFRGDRYFLKLMGRRVFLPGWLSPVTPSMPLGSR